MGNISTRSISPNPEFIRACDPKNNEQKRKNGNPFSLTNLLILNEKGFHDGKLSKPIAQDQNSYL